MQAAVSVPLLRVSQLRMKGCRSHYEGPLSDIETQAIYSWGIYTKD